MIIAQMVELVDTLVLEASAIVREGSSPFLGTIFRRFTMRQIVFENIYNKERYVVHGKQVKKFINGIEYITVVPEKGKIREVLIRKDYLKKVTS